MRVIVCRCSGLIDITGLDLGADNKIEVYDNLCQKKPGTNPGEKAIIAGCSPSLMAGMFPDVDAEFVNLKDHVFLVNHPVSKAADLLIAAIAKGNSSPAVTRKIFPIRTREAAIIGGGIAGMEVARALVSASIKVTIVEKSPFLGGTVAKLDRLYPEGMPYSHTVMPLISSVVNNVNAKCLLNSEVGSVRGTVGDYKLVVNTTPRGVIECNGCGKCTGVCPVEVADEGRKRKAIYGVNTYPPLYVIDFAACTKCGECVEACPGRIDLEQKSETKEFAAGAIVVATGLKFYDLKKVVEYGYQRYKKVMTTLEFERAIASGCFQPKKVVIICCAGSRDINHLEYCSKICCFIALKEAKLVKDRFPDSQVYVIAMDMRSYGSFEFFYSRLRELGVIFLKGKPAEVFADNGRTIVRTEDLYTGELLDIDSDAVVLSAGFTCDSEIFGKLSLATNGLFPVLFENSTLGTPELPRGIFIAGSASFPAGVAETLSDARKAAFSVLTMLNHDEIETTHAMALVNVDSCSTCRICIGTCPYSAISLVDEKIAIRQDLCMGCGICSSACPSAASQLEKFTTAGIMAEIRSLVNKGDILALLCRWSAYNATEVAAAAQVCYPENVKIIRIPCTGAVDPLHVLTAIERGARGVLIGGCYPDACHYGHGNSRARMREQILKNTLLLFGHETSKVRLEWIGKDEAQKFAGIVLEMNK